VITPIYDHNTRGQIRRANVELQRLRNVLADVTCHMGHDNPLALEAGVAAVVQGLDAVAARLLAAIHGDCPVCDGSGDDTVSMLHVAPACPVCDGSGRLVKSAIRELVTTVDKVRADGNVDLCFVPESEVPA